MSQEREDPASAIRAARDHLFRFRTDYDGAVRGFRWPEISRFNYALDWFDVIGRERDREALRVVSEAGSESRTYAELSAASGQIANFLRARGLARGDAVLLMMGNTVALWECMLAIAKLGAVMIPAAPLLSPGDLQDRIVRGAVRLVIASADYADRFPADAALERVSVGGRADGWLHLDDARAFSTAFEPDGETHGADPLLLYFTSGTTAKPKLVLHSHLSYPVGHLSTMYWLGLQPGDRHLNISSPGWAKHAWSCVFAPWLAEATVVVLDHPRFNAVATLDALAREGVTTFCAPPTVWRMLIQHDLRAWKTSLRELASAGEPLNPEVIHQVRQAWGLTVRDGFGQTETCALIGNTPGQPIVEGAVGRALPGYDIALKDPDGVDAAEGEISLRLDRVRPLGLMQGYRVDGEVVTIDAPIYRTGDVAVRDEAGVFTYVGRADDVFKASDYRISPFELESVLIEHPAVAEAAVVPSPDPVRLATPKAFVALVPGAVPDAQTAWSILRHARAALGDFKRIRRIEFAELPKTISGKIRRVELRRLEAHRRASGETGETAWDEEDLAAMALGRDGQGSSE
jgi:acetyl-CoA synthetase